MLSEINQPKKTNALCLCHVKTKPLHEVPEVKVKGSQVHGNRKQDGGCQGLGVDEEDEKKFQKQMVGMVAQQCECT